MKNRTLVLSLALSVVVLSASALAADGEITYSSGNTLYVFPWRMCLIVSALVSVGFYLARGGSAKH